METVAWAAGLFEGEGSISVVTKSSYPRLTMKMTDRDVVERFAAIVDCGYIMESGWYRRNGYKPQWVWQTKSIAEVKSILALFYPLLGERRKAKADEVLELIERKAEHHQAVRRKNMAIARTSRGIHKRNTKGRFC